jgi:hypothetical protein
MRRGASVKLEVYSKKRLKIKKIKNLKKSHGSGGHAAGTYGHPTAYRLATSI